MFRYLMHLSATLKKLLTILLLIVLAGDSSGYLFAKSYEVSFAHQTEENCDRSSEEKKEKEYLTVPCSITFSLTDSKIFGPYGSALVLFPVFDHHTPPPDVKA